MCKNARNRCSAVYAAVQNATVATPPAGEGWEGPPYEYGVTWGGENPADFTPPAGEVGELCDEVRSIAARHPDDYSYGRLIFAATLLAKQAAEVERNRKAHPMLLDLLAVIHRDGGRKTQEIGLDLAWQQAMRISSERIAAKEAAEAAREQAEGLLRLIWQTLAPVENVRVQDVIVSIENFLNPPTKEGDYAKP